MSDKILTVIVPSYNMEKYLPKCLGSLVVAPELMERIEVIVVNDGSKDRTSEIGHEFEQRYVGVFRVVDKANGNYGSCINVGLKLAQGRYVKVLDADDWFDPAQFERYLAFVAKQVSVEPQPDMLFNDFTFVQPDGVQYDLHDYSYVTQEGFSIGDFTFEPGRDLWMHGVAFKTENLRKIGYEQSTGISYTDEEWISQPLTTVRSIAYCPGVLYMYLMGREGQTCGADQYLKCFWMQVQILKKLIRLYEPQRGLLPAANDRYMQRHLWHRCELTYRSCLMNVLPKISDESFRELDELVTAVLPDIGSRLNQLSVRVPHTPLQFKCVQEWRRRNSKRTAKFWLLEKYMNLLSFARRFRK